MVLVCRVARVFDVRRSRRGLGSGGRGTARTVTSWRLAAPGTGPGFDWNCLLFVAVGVQCAVTDESRSLSGLCRNESLLKWRRRNTFPRSERGVREYSPVLAIAAACRDGP